VHPTVHVQVLAQRFDIGDEVFVALYAMSVAGSAAWGSLSPHPRW